MTADILLTTEQKHTHKDKMYIESTQNADHVCSQMPDEFIVLLQSCYAED